MRSRRSAIPLALAGVMTVLLASTVAAAPTSSPRAVYSQTNDPGGNAVLLFWRGADGSLSAPLSYPTGGLGTGAGLGSQGSVVLSDGGRWLLAVNAGSDELSLFRVRQDGLRLKDRIASGGDMPISATIDDRLIYVVNAGGDGNIAGFRIRSGELRAIPNSVRPLSAAAAGPAEIAFTNDGSQLVVTEKNTNVISTFKVRRGHALPATANASAGTTPFGFAFDGRGNLIVSEAFGGAASASAVSSYRVRDGGGLKTVSASVATTQTSACWIVIGGHYAYAANTGSGTVSSYWIGQGGHLTLAQAVAGNTGTGSAPADEAVSGTGRFLYVLGGGSDEITIFQIGADGGLDEIGSVAIPATGVGLAAN